MSSSNDQVSELQNSFGNEQMEKQNYTRALHFYTQAIFWSPHNHVYYSNRSACHASMKSWIEAINDAQACIDLNPDFSKGYYRLAIALAGKDDLTMERAMEMLDKASMGQNDAATLKKLAALRKLVENQRFDSGEELIVACAKKHWSRVKSLLENGRRIDLERRGQEGWHFDRTPFLFAVCAGQVDIINLLIQKGADVNAVCNKKHSAMGWAVHSRQIPSVEALLNHGVSMCCHEETLFDLAFFPSVSYNIGCDLMDLLRLLCENGADVNARHKNKFKDDLIEMGDASGWSGTYMDHGLPPLFTAVRHGPEICRLLLDSGANVNAFTLHRTPLMEALRQLHNSGNLAHFPVVLLLIQRGAKLFGRVLREGACPLAWPDYCEGIPPEVKTQIAGEARWYRRKHFMMFLSAFGKLQLPEDGTNVTKVFQMNVLCGKIMVFL